MKLPRLSLWFSLASVVGIAAVAACSGNSRQSGFDDGTGADGGPGSSGGSSSGFGGGSDGGPCHIKAGSDDTSDFDKDGYSAADGDSDDCNPNINPGAFEVPGNGKDDDSDGEVDEVETCDTGLSMTSNDPFDGAKAMGLCQRVDPKATGKDKKWGVLSAKYTWANGSASSVDMDGFGIRDSLGVNKPQEGTTMLALSSGTARNLTSHTKSKGGLTGHSDGLPAGYVLQEAPACPGVKTGAAYDGAALVMEIRVPTNAKGFSYQQNFFTEEFPVYICDRYNDRFVATLSPTPPGLPDSNNIAFDTGGNPISVNNSLLQVCKSQNAGGKNFPCPLGTGPLSGTTFENHAGTGWLVTQAPAKPGDVITLTFAIWDSGDPNLDSTVLLDKFEWSNDEKNTGTAPVPPK